MTRPLTWDLRDHLDRVQVLVQLRNGRVMYRDPAPEPPRRGRPRKHSADRFECKDPATWGIPDRPAIGGRGVRPVSGMTGRLRGNAWRNCVARFRGNVAGRVGLRIAAMPGCHDREGCAICGRRGYPGWLR